MSKPDGGQAFPRSMSEDPKDFGTALHFAQDGMSLRDWFAGQAGEEARQLLTAYYGDDWMGSSLDDAINSLTETKLKLADAMLNKLNKDTTQTGEANEPTTS